MARARPVVIASSAMNRPGVQERALHSRETHRFSSTNLKDPSAE